MADDDEAASSGVDAGTSVGTNGISPAVDKEGTGSELDADDPSCSRIDTSGDGSRSVAIKKQN